MVRHVLTNLEASYAILEGLAGKVVKIAKALITTDGDCLGDKARCSSAPGLTRPPLGVYDSQIALHVLGFRFSKGVR